jgi:hypothetical protein
MTLPFLEIAENEVEIAFILILGEERDVRND